MKNSKLFHLSALVILALSLSMFITTMTTAQSGAEVHELAFVNHLQLDAPEQDVLWMDEEGALWRVAPEHPLSTLNQEMYASTTGAEHNPFRLGDNPLGPFEAGEALGLTLGEWLAASGSGTYTVDGDSATLELSFSDLVPNGVYTLWCSQIYLPDDFMIDNYPCGAADGSENTFIADEDGNATYNVTMEPIMPTTAEMLSVFAVNYHSDGNTYGEDPGKFGFNAHVQILAVAPAADSE